MIYFVLAILVQKIRRPLNGSIPFEHFSAHDTILPCVYCAARKMSLLPGSRSFASLPPAPPCTALSTTAAPPPPAPTHYEMFALAGDAGTHYAAIHQGCHNTLIVLSRQMNIQKRTMLN